MRINNNISALFAFNRLTGTNSAMDKSMEKLSSGYRINRAGDDAAGLAISEKMRAQIKGLNQAVRNAQDGISLIQTAEGALNETHAILHRMRELSVQAANGTSEQDDKDKINAEMKQLQTELTRIAEQTEFNKKTLFKGSFANAGSGITFHIGANEDQNMEITIGTMTASALGITTTAIGAASGGFTATLANSLIGILDDAISKVSEQRSDLGAVQNRLEHTINNLRTASENLTAAESRIRDVDMAEEMMEFTRTQILTQAGTAMMAQANMKPQSVLQLFS